ncbi:ABC transporter ATP-binding protein [Pseudaminobacter arsenicus]|uniref:ABC transporter ATP-binding protein n=1 Tax=Borborobacter arsenicus TaxID=1851146 RepID=A0A432V373_9HYPH|nr:ABC transporter ATP-binding protein [Pseudaminobacter arsenicus]RUM96631.1 ABC transporter ATP-binding protein [Pseudaminobacter arsenicus]
MSFIEISNVDLVYGKPGEKSTVNDTLAVSDTSITIEDGEFLALVGPSGCGKSTLLKLIAGLIRPSRGSVKVSGQEVTCPLKIVGMAFQNATLLPWRNIRDNVMLPLEIVEPYRGRHRQDRAKNRERADILLEKVGLAGFAEKMPWQLSGGMQQRAQLCRALIHEPSILLLDEPFAALDTFTREDLWGVLQELWEFRKCTIIIVTHELREAAFLAGKVSVMSSRPGRIIKTSSVDIPRPRTLETTFEPQFVELVQDLRHHISLGKTS